MRNVVSIVNYDNHLQSNNKRHKGQTKAMKESFLPCPLPSFMNCLGKLKLYSVWSLSPISYRWIIHVLYTDFEFPLFAFELHI